MFSFSLGKPSRKKKDWKLVINEHEISCSTKNLESISKYIFEKSKEEVNKNSFKINIPEFDDPLICSESDYEYFQNIFNFIPIQITNTNKEILKIFANKLEIKELSSLTELFESFFDIFSNYQPLQIQKSISNELLDIEEENFDRLLDRLNDLYQNKEDINLTLDFFCNIFLTACLIRPDKIELLISFLKKYEENTKGHQFEYFKKNLLEEFNEQTNNYYTHYNYDKIIKRRLSLHHPIKTIRFILYYLASISEIDENEIKNNQNFSGYYNYNTYRYERPDQKFTEDEIETYKNTGYCPNKVYKTIKSDDLELFTELITQNFNANNDFNNTLPITNYERNPDIFYKEYKIHYLDLAAFYGSEQIFNYIMLNIDSSTIEYATLRLAFFGGNISIISKCLEKIEMDDSILEKCLLTTIKYNYNEVLEWLFENYDVTNTSIYKTTNLGDRLLENAIKFNNIDAVILLLSIGVDHTPLFSYSLLYNQFILAKLATKLPYTYNFSSNNLVLKPYSYKYKEI